jgi:hypothetical protein
MSDIYIKTRKIHYIEDSYSEKTFYHLEIKKILGMRNKIIECYYTNGYLEIYRLERNGIVLYSNLLALFNYIKLKYYV